ncbi:MAG: hypothetical protein RR060_00025 [Victivallaceae bacterium]
MNIRATNFNQLFNGEKFLPIWGGMVYSALAYLEILSTVLLRFDMELFRLCSADTEWTGLTAPPENH